MGANKTNAATFAEPSEDLTDHKVGVTRFLQQHQVGYDVPSGWECCPNDNGSDDDRTNSNETSAGATLPGQSPVSAMI